MCALRSDCHAHSSPQPSVGPTVIYCHLVGSGSHTPTSAIASGQLSTFFSDCYLPASPFFLCFSGSLFDGVCFFQNLSVCLTRGLSSLSCPSPSLLCPPPRSFCPSFKLLLCLSESLELAWLSLLSLLSAEGPSIWVPPSHPSSPSCRNDVIPRGGSTISNSTHSTARRVFPLTASIPSGALAREPRDFYLRGQHPTRQAGTGLQGPCPTPSGPQASLLSILGQLSQPLLSLSHFSLHDVRYLPGLSRGGGAVGRGASPVLLPVSSPRGGSGHKKVST